MDFDEALDEDGFEGQEEQEQEDGEVEQEETPDIYEDEEGNSFYKDEDGKFVPIEDEAEDVEVFKDDEGNYFYIGEDGKEVYIDEEGNPIEEGEEKEEEDIFSVKDVEEKGEEEGEEEEGEEEEEDDEDLYSTLKLTEPMQHLMREADKEDREVEKDFIVYALDNDASLEELAENKIFSFKDLWDSHNELRDMIEPGSRMLPKDNDEEGWNDLLEEKRGFPKTAEGYPDELFEDIDFGGKIGLLRDNPEKVEELREYFLSRNYSIYHARDYLLDEQESTQNYLSFAQKELKDYKNENKQHLKQALGSNYLAEVRAINEMIQKYGPEYAEEFKNTKGMNSANHYLMLHRIRSAQFQLPKVNKNEVERLDMMSTEALQAEYDKILESKEYSEEWENGTPKQRKVWELKDKQLLRYMLELQKR